MWRLLHFEGCLIFLATVFSCLLLPPTFTNADGNTTTDGNIRPPVVNVGALFAVNSIIGKVAKTAMDLAVDDVNNNSNLLNGTKLVLSTVDEVGDKYAFMGIEAALELLKKDVVAIVGPQQSLLAPIVSHITNELQIPLLSFAATDPTLTSYEYPSFIRMTHSDFDQMSAIAALVRYYGWREVVAVYIDDDYGRNGISLLGNALGNAGAKITNKAALPPRIDQSGIGDVLAKLALGEARVFVVHTTSDVGLSIFSKAKDIGMLSSGYVWIVTDWLSSILDSTILERDKMNSLQGVIGLRRHIPSSEQHDAFMRNWKSLQTADKVGVSLNVFGLYAYDSIFMIGHAIDSYLNQGGYFSFVENSAQLNETGSKSELATLKIFEGGRQLREIILETNFTGIAGRVQLDKNRNLMGSTFEIFNVAGTGFRSIGHWSNCTGVSVTAPEYLPAINHTQSHVEPELSEVIWPGESKVVPRGWVFPNHGKELVLGVPKKKGFKEFVTVENDGNMVKGFCIDVFAAAVNLLPYAVPYRFRPYGTDGSPPNYNELVEQVAFKNFDAAVGDITIVTNRSKIVDFTQPYVESGLVVVVPVKEIDSNAWAFLRPFTVEMWCTTGAIFLVIGAVVWILEHRINPEFRGHPKQQVMNALWFSFSTMFFSQRENTLSTLGRVVLIIWLFVVLIIRSSYTASLTSILTVQQLSPTIQGIKSLLASNVPIGYQVGSFVAEYLSEEFNIAKSRLVPLDSPASYATALSLGPSQGGVAAVVDELPYIQLFLSTQCKYRIVGQEFTKGGWGFVYPKESQLAVDMSTAILTLSESGELQRIHDKWLASDICHPQGNVIQSNQFGLRSFLGLFLLTGIMCFVALVIFLVRMICQFTRYAGRYLKDSPDTSHSLSSRSAKLLRSFAAFVDEREEDKRTQSLKSKRTDRKMNLETEFGQPQSPSIQLGSLRFSGDNSLSHI